MINRLLLYRLSSHRLEVIIQPPFEKEGGKYLQLERYSCYPFTTQTSSVYPTVIFN